MQHASARFRAFAVKRAWRRCLRASAGTAKPGESDPVAILRTQLIGTLGNLGDTGVIAEARRRFAARNTTRRPCPWRCARPSSAIVARHADAATWDELHALAQAEKTPLIKDQLYSLLAYADNEALAQRALELALTDEPGATNSAGMIGIAAYQHPGDGVRLRAGPPRQGGHRWSTPPRAAATTRAWAVPRSTRR